MAIITDEYLTLTRALLDGDDGTGQRLMDELAARDGDEHAARVVSLLASTALFTLLRRRFPNGYRSADIIGLVARARTTVPGAAEDLDPAVAEQVLYGLLGNAAAAQTVVKLDQDDEDALGAVLPIVLRAVLEQDGITGDALGELLAYERPVAEKWLATAGA